jgi:hypothetical protein
LILGFLDVHGAKKCPRKEGALSSKILERKVICIDQ